MKEKIVHLGNANLKLKSFPCGLKHKICDGQEHSVDPLKVTCYACIKAFLYKQKEANSKTHKWLLRLSELKIEGNNQ